MEAQEDDEEEAEDETEMIHTDDEDNEEPPVENVSLDCTANAQPVVEAAPCAPEPTLPAAPSPKPADAQVTPCNKTSTLAKDASGGANSG